MPSPAASVASSTWTSGSCRKLSCALRRSSRPMPPWISDDRLGAAEQRADLALEVVSVSRCSVKRTSFWRGDGTGCGIGPAP